MTVLRFWLNGSERTIKNPDPTQTVLDYLRRTEELTGTKSSCAQGGCGACTAVVRTMDGNGLAKHESFNTCLRLLVSLHGAHVTTVEGIGSSRSGLHPLQDAIASGGGSQCGFCTPGMVMAAYSAFAEAASPGAALTPEALEAKLDGNICRCTGYSAILTSLAGATDGVAPAELVVDRQDPQDPAVGLDAVDTDAVFTAEDGDPVWAAPASLAALDELVASTGAGSVRFVVGNTSVGVYPATGLAPDGAGKVAGGKLPVYLRGIPELTRVTVSDSGLEFGGAASISDVLRALEDNASASPGTFPYAARHVGNIASSHVRNAAGWAGNLCMVAQHGFASDLATVLCGLGASVTLRACDGTLSSVSVLDLLSSSSSSSSSSLSGLADGTLLYGLTIPFGGEGEQFRSYRAAIRPVNAHALANAAFRATVDGSGTVTAACVVVGAVASAPIAVAGAAAALVGASLGDGAAAEAATQAAVSALAANVTVHPEPAYVTRAQPEGKAAYRAGLLGSFVVKFVEELGGRGDGVVTVPFHQARPAFSAEQTTESESKYGSCAKIGSDLQASGEARYIDDIPSCKHTLYAAFVVSTRGAVSLDGVDVEAGKGLPGVVDVLVAADIGGSNSIGIVPGEQEVLVSDKVPYIGAPVALVVARTQAQANAAAAAVPVSYGEPYEELIVSLKEAAAAGRFLPAAENLMEVGDVEAGLASAGRVLRGSLSVGSQDHFYMEKQTAYARVDEGDRITLYSANQGPEFVKDKVSDATGVSAVNLDVRCSKVGGGFGGKATHALYVAAGTTAAAAKLGCPVRTVLPISTNMALHGGRFSYEVDYEVGFDEKTGRITALNIESLADSGAAHDLAMFCVHEYTESLDTVYAIESARFHTQTVRTNLAPTTAVRGPGHPGASFVIESILDEVAAALEMAPEAVREANFYNARNAVSMDGLHMRDMNLADLYGRAKDAVKYEETAAAIAEFNASHKWVKRGVSVQASRYGVAQAASSGAPAMVQVSRTGNVIVHHGGMEIGQGIHTKVVGVVAATLGVAPDTVKVAEMSTDALANSGFTGGSVTSECCAEAARRACLEIKDRVAHIKEELWRKSGEEPSFYEVVKVANSRHILLSATSNFVPIGRAHNQVVRPWQTSGVQYSAFSAAASVVEVDILTGAVEILEMHIVYDVAQSLNELVDMGQITGAAVMGLGALMMEESLISADGVNHATDTWEYKPPVAATVPRVFNVTLLNDKMFPYNDALNTKAVGEPPISLAMTAVSATRYAVAASRRERGASVDGLLSQAPITVDRVWGAVEG